MMQRATRLTDDDVDDYVRHLQAHLPTDHAHLSVEQVRAVLDAETAFFEAHFGKIHGWRALLRSVFGRGEPSPEAVEAALPAFEEHAVQALAARGDLSREDIRAVMQVEGEVGPRWVPSGRPEGATVNVEEDGR